MNKHLFLMLVFIVGLTSLYSCQEENGSSTNPHDIYSVNVQSTLSVRKEPSTEADKLGSLRKDEQVEVENIHNGWAQIRYNAATGYVNANYLTLKHSKGSTLVEKETETKDPFLTNNKDWYRLLYNSTPFIGVILFVLLIIAANINADRFMHVMLFLLGLTELFFSAGYNEIESGVNPWFCDPNEMGWIWTIVNYFILLGVLMLQHYSFKGYAGHLRLGCGGLILFYILVAAVGISLSSLLVSVEYFYAAPIAIFLLWLFLYKQLDDKKEAFIGSIFVAVAFGGLSVFFLQMLGLLLMGGIILILAQAFMSGKSSTEKTGPDVVINDCGNDKYITYEGQSDSRGRDQHGYGWTRTPGTNEWHRD